MFPRKLTLSACALAVALLACNLGAPAPAALPTATPEPTAAPPPTEAPAEPIVVTFQEPVFNLYSLDGTLLGTRPGDGMDFPRPNTAQVVGEDIYYVRSSAPDPGQMVVRVTPGGVETLDFTSLDEFGGLAFAVSPDGSHIAWSNTSFASGPPVSQLWMAAIDGSGATLVAESSPDDDIAEWFILEPVTWLPDGSLVYAWQITGIGGYILFFGWSSLYQYDPATATTTPLAALQSEGAAPCWNAVTPDAAYILGACGGSAQMVEKQIASGASTLFPMLPDQGQAGAGAYSPSGERLAYGIARGNPDDEAGQVVAVAPRGSAPASIASEAPGYFHRILWIDEARMAVEASGIDVQQTQVDLVGLDGTRTTIGEGQLIGLMPASP